MIPKLSKPTASLQSSYDVVVIGSGYGGSISASRMARAGKKVCLLEKGREFRPGEYPDTITEASPQLQIHTPTGHIGNQAGLYEVVVGKGINVVKGCGLGGTSLINANVSLEPEMRVFEQALWPTPVKNDMKGLFDGMALAKNMLKPTPYPVGQPNYPPLPKVEAHKKSAVEVGDDFSYLNINVNFEDQLEGNHVGVAQKACNNCGDCCSGCNVSAKNTTLMNYLPDAVNYGAEIFCEVAVSHLERKGDKWLVFYQLINVGREKFEAPLLFVEADMVFLGAGSLGSTQLLLNSAAKGGLSISKKIGDRFTGNGDVLGFGYNTDVTINGIGYGNNTDIEPVGPCIVSVIDARGKPELTDGMVIEEGSIPGAIRSLLKPMLFVSGKLEGQDTDSGFRDWVAESAREADSLVRGAYHGAIKNTQTYLIMTHDSDNGKMSLNAKGDLTIDWEGVGKEKIFQKASDNLLKATKALGGTYIKNPVWNETFDFDLVTVHPLGGCIMGDTAETGVTNHIGQVFHGESGNDLYPNLYVTDGAIIPCALGVNPLLTISGFAERNVKLIAEEHGCTINYDLPARKAQEAAPTTAGVMFTETMKGFFSVNEKTDYEAGFTKGTADNSPLAFTLTVQTQDVDKFIKDPNHTGTMVGTVVANHLSTKPLVVSEGRFNLFVKDPNNPAQKYMDYNMKMHSEEGKTYYFSGFKDVRDDKGFDVWTDLSTLFITLYDGEDTNAPVLAKGILHIAPQDFAQQMTTMKALNTKGAFNKIEALVAFGKLFGGDVWETYFADKL